MMNVLVVDDSAVMRKVIIRELKQCGIEEVTEATDGIEGLEAASRESFDLILMDWNMPGLLGIDVVRKLREAQITTPIMMVTTEGERNNVVIAIQAGANNYLVKPFSSDDFSQKIEQLQAVKV
ncbi:MAG: response regulator [Vampirovibrionales bacterium]|jgi:two-component system chemotaxis response regulator CheY|nr:response regulator [Vampirovibrionales bacterium]